MMGANWGNHGGMVGNRRSGQTVIKKYAWFPIKTTNDKWTWFNEYYIIETFYDENGKPPVKSLFWKSILNKNEYLVWIIKNPVK